MNEFKFNCPTCGQHILAAHDWIGRRIDCPSCKSNLTIPHPEKIKKPGPPGKPPVPKPATPRSGETRQVKAPATDSNTKVAQPPPPEPVAKVGPKDKTETVAAGSTARPAETPATPPERLRVAVFTPAVKLDMVRAVRRRIEEESHWLPGRINDANAYAATVSGGENVAVEATSAEATRFSLIGAFLAEFHVRQVVTTATGRRRFLDQEIPDAMREVLLSEMSDEEREQAEDSLSEKDLMSISHAQCLAVLEALENRYSQRMEHLQAEQAKRKLGKVRLPDLVRKLEKKARVSPEDVATALYHELMDVHRRLERLESRAGTDKEIRKPEQG
jgi:hypothetical protein